MIILQKGDMFQKHGVGTDAKILLGLSKKKKLLTRYAQYGYKTGKWL